MPSFLLVAAIIERSQTVDQVADALARTHARLNGLNVFESITFELVESKLPPLASTAADSRDAQDIDVTVTVKEKSRLWGLRLDVQREMSTAENSLSMAGKIRNVTGFADWIQLSGKC